MDVTLFWGLTLQGYHGDTSKTFLCGDVDESLIQLVKVNGFFFLPYFLIFMKPLEADLVIVLNRSQKNAWRKVYRFVKMEQASNKSGR